MSVRSPYKRAPKLQVTEHSWKVNDTVTVGSTRWIVRVVKGEHIELEAANVTPGIWWTTTTAHLPEKSR